MRSIVRGVGRFRGRVECVLIMIKKNHRVCVMRGRDMNTKDVAGMKEWLRRRDARSMHVNLFPSSVKE